MNESMSDHDECMHDECSAGKTKLGNHKRSAAPPHRSCGACRSRISRDARFCASSSNAAATREEAPRPAPPPPPGRTPVVCMMQTKKTWAPFPSFPRASFQAPPSFLSSSFFLSSLLFKNIFLLMIVRGPQGGPRWIGGWHNPAQSFHHNPSGRGSDFP